MIPQTTKIGGLSVLVLAIPIQVGQPADKIEGYPSLTLSKAR
jgi:hypothetical protein